MVVTRFLDPKEDASAGRFRPAPYSSLAYRLSCYTSLCINIITDLPVGIQYPAHFTRPCTVIRRRYICAGPYKIFLVVLRSEEHTSELQSSGHLVCRLLL